MLVLVDAGCCKILLHLEMTLCRSSLAYCISLHGPGPYCNEVTALGVCGASPKMWGLNGGHLFSDTPNLTSIEV